MTKAAEWTGPVGDAWASEWERTDRSFAGLAVHLDALVRDAVTPEVRVAADIGCGAGATSIALATARPAVRVTGIDLSPELIAVALRRASALPNLAFEQGSVDDVISKFAPVDLFVSRHGVMFFDDPVAAFRALRSAAAPGARLIFSCFNSPALNPWATEIAGAILGAPPASPPPGYVPGPFAFADPDVVHRLLRDSGWHDGACLRADFHYRTGDGIDPVADAISFFTRIGPAAPILRAAAPAERAGMLDRIATVATGYRSGGVVDFRPPHGYGRPEPDQRAVETERNAPMTLIVHHLENSRSQRILWMLEELGLPYEIKRYERNKKTMLAPPELKRVHPLGKSPVLEDTAAGKIIIETGAIVEYLVELADGKLGAPAHRDDVLRYRQYLHYAEGSLMPPLLVLLVLNRVPLMGKPAAKRIQPMIDVHLDFIETELASRPWFAGAEMTGADIMMSFPLEAARSRAGLGPSRPATIAWLDKIHARPAYQAALVKGGPYAYA